MIGGAIYFERVGTNTFAAPHSFSPRQVFDVLVSLIIGVEGANQSRRKMPNGPVTSDAFACRAVKQASTRSHVAVLPLSQLNQ